MASGIEVLFYLLSSIILSVESSLDPAANQLYDYNKTYHGQHFIETRYGVPVGDIESSLTIGPRGPILLQDVILLDTFSSFDRERIPSRVVHAPGSGAFGYFEVTKDITKYTKAKVFDKVGKRTKIGVRFSLALGDKGSSETARDDRGFAIKFYTEDGIWDIVGYNSPVFFVRDPMLFPMLTHANLRNPVTNIKDPNMEWDMFSLLPETINQQLRFFGDIGIPDGWRHMDGHGQHTFKMVNAEEEAVYVKFHFLTGQGVRNLTTEEGLKIAAMDTGYATRDLYDAIAKKNYPYWTFYIQVMTFDQAEKFRWNPFDVTKLWPEEDYPLMEVGKFVLNENPRNYFAQVEQIAFSPAHLVPGIEPTPDKMLQARLFAYSDTQRYRLGTNHLQLPVNCPFHGHPVNNYQRDGQGTFFSQKGAPNYYPNSFNGPRDAPKVGIKPYNVSGDVKRYNTENEDNFSQPRMYWNQMSKAEQERLVQTIGDSLQMAYPCIQVRALKNFGEVDKSFRMRIQSRMKLPEDFNPGACSSVTN